MKRFKKPTPRLAHFMAQWREARGYTQIKMSELVGLSPPSISRIEKGITPYYQDVIEVYAEILGCTPADLISRPPSQDLHPPENLWTLWEGLREERRPQAVAILKALRDSG